jgi:2-keto-3-deoxy-6-phosphogluconate aldolase
MNGADRLKYFAKETFGLKASKELHLNIANKKVKEKGGWGESRNNFSRWHRKQVLAFK